MHAAESKRKSPGTVTNVSKRSKMVEAGDAVGPEADAAQSKMVEAGDAVGPEADAARARMIAAGYSVETCPLKKVHCNEQPGCENLSWMENGFIQCFTKVDGRCARVMDYAPGQQLQPHQHDIDEQFLIGGGAVLVSKWEASTPADRESYRLKAGDLLEIPAGCPHALFCDPTDGLQFHELVGEGEEAFQKRSTEFLLTKGYKIDSPACS